MMVLDSPRGAMPVTPTRAIAHTHVTKGNDVDPDDAYNTTHASSAKSASRTSAPTRADMAISLRYTNRANDTNNYNDTNDTNKSNDISDVTRQQLRTKFERAQALVASVFNKFYNGSARAVDPFVIRCLQEEETRLFSLQCFIEQGPTETSRERKDSNAKSSVAAQATHATLWSRVFSLCGGYGGGPNTVMREWDALSSHAAGRDDAMRDYITVVDKILPGWDRPLPHDFPVAPHDKFWRDDLGAAQCQSCGAAFSNVHCRRHHCRLCFDIFCATCCAHTIDLALCPGAPVRRQRVCLLCFEAAENERSLLDVKRLIRENHALEQQIKDVTAAAVALVLTKQQEEATLRADAVACGCVLRDIDAAIARQIGSPVAVTVKLPPAHKFAPRESVDANDQLALAHRQLLMGLKAAQCRATKAAEKMDTTLRVLRDAIRAVGAGRTWHIGLGFAAAWLSLRDLRVLRRVSHAMRTQLERLGCERKCVLAQPLPSPAWRAFVWQAQWLDDEKVRDYLADLAEAVRARAESSDSDSDDDEHEQHDNGEGQRTTRRSVVAYELVGAHVSPTRSSRRRSVWKTVYEFILARCDETDEFDAQIHGDVGRTFGVPSLRSRQSPAQQKSAATAPRKAYQHAGASTLETPLALRKTALTNVLRAFASVNSQVGYCQGMDHVAALLLSVVDWNESDAFWMLTSLLASPQYELDQLYGPGLPHLRLRVFQLERLMAIHLPELSSHLQELDFPVSMLTTTWFMTLFANMDALSYDLVLRVLDGFFVSGWKFVFRVALVVLEALQPHMLASSFDEMPQVLYDIHTLAPQFAGVDAEALVHCAMRFKVTNRQLQQLALEHNEHDEHNSVQGTKRGVLRRTSTAQSPSHATNGNGAGVTVGVAIIGSPKANNGVASSAPSSSNGFGRHDASGHPNESSQSLIRPVNGRSPPKRASTIGVPSLEIHHPRDDDTTPSASLSHRHSFSSPSPLRGRRSRNSSSSASASNDSECGGNRQSPDKTRSEAAYLAPPQRYAMSSSSLQYGLATPLNANYYF